MRGRPSLRPRAQPAGPSLTASEPPGSQPTPLSLEPLSASKAGQPDPPVPPALGPQLSPEGLEWKGRRAVIWRREFSGARLDPALWGCRAEIHAPFRMEKAETCLEPIDGLRADRLSAESRKGQGPPRCGHGGATKSFIPLLPSPTPGAPGLNPILPWNKQCVLRNHTQACDIYGDGVEDSIWAQTSGRRWAHGVCDGPLAGLTCCFSLKAQMGPGFLSPFFPCSDPSWAPCSGEGWRGRGLLGGEGLILHALQGPAAPESCSVGLALPRLPQYYCPSRPSTYRKPSQSTPVPCLIPVPTPASAALA